MRTEKTGGPLDQIRMTTHS